jgi:hypothetical protein
MPREVRRTNVRVEVVPRRPGDYGWASFGPSEEPVEKTISRAEDIAEQIRRHVDGLPSYGDRGVSIVWDDEPVCSHCGATWTTAPDSPHNNGCCHKDSEVLEALEAAKAGVY